MISIENVKLKEKNNNHTAQHDSIKNHMNGRERESEPSVYLCASGFTTKSFECHTKIKLKAMRLLDRSLSLSHFARECVCALIRKPYLIVRYHIVTNVIIIIKHHCWINKRAEEVLMFVCVCFCFFFFFCFSPWNFQNSQRAWNTIYLFLVTIVRKLCAACRCHMKWWCFSIHFILFYCNAWFDPFWTR